METWELVARERIRDTIARYNWSGDAFRLEELAGAFCPDGELEIRHGETHHGREGILAFLGGVSPGAQPAAPRPEGAPKRMVRHLLTNTRFLELTPDHALVASYFTVVTEVGLDHHGRYRDRFEPVGDEWLIRHRYVATDWAAPDTTMVPPDGVG